MMKAASCRVLLWAWLVSAAGYSTLAAGEVVADPAAALPSKVLFISDVVSGTADDAASCHDDAC